MLTQLLEHSSGKWPPTMQITASSLKIAMVVLKGLWS